MIGFLRGKVVQKGTRALIVETGGVGYVVATTPEAILKAQDSEVAEFWTHLAVRDDALELFGFPTEEELSLFKLLISVSGIGPRTALNVLAVATPENLRRAVSSGETAHLTKVSGVGKKIADKIVLELKDKIGSGTEEGTSFKEEVDALEALKSLGYSHAEGREALKQVAKTISGTGERVKAALKILGK